MARPSLRGPDATPSDAGYRAALYDEAVKAGEEAALAFDRIYREELSRLEDENGKHLPAPERVALASEAASTAIARINLGHAGGVGEVDLGGMTELEKFNYLRGEIEARGGEFRTEDMAMNVKGGLPDRPVNAYSAGCQVIPHRPSGDESSTLYWEDFHQMITEDPVYGTKDDLIPYTLADVPHMPSTR